MPTTLGGTPRRNKGDKPEQQKRAIARGKEQEAVTGIKPTVGGSSGTTLFMSRVQKRAFADIEADAVHVGDLVAVFNDVRKTPAKSMLTNLTVPASYQHELIDMMDACAMGFVMIRCYYVPRRPFMEEVGGDELNGGGGSGDG